MQHTIYGTSYGNIRQAKCSDVEIDLQVQVGLVDLVAPCAPLGCQEDPVLLQMMAVVCVCSNEKTQHCMVISSS